jgi:hypothetical protein
LPPIARNASALTVTAGVARLVWIQSSDLSNSLRQSVSWHTLPHGPSNKSDRVNINSLSHALKLRILKFVAAAAHVIFQFEELLLG